MDVDKRFEGGRLKDYSVKVSCDGAGSANGLLGFPVCPECYEQSPGKFELSERFGGWELSVEYSKTFYRVGK